jgi:hypothetical protein
MTTIPIQVISVDFIKSESQAGCVHRAVPRAGHRGRSPHLCETVSGASAIPSSSAIILVTAHRPESLDQQLILLIRDPAQRKAGRVPLAVWAMLQAPNSRTLDLPNVQPSAAARTCARYFVQRKRADVEKVDGRGHPISPNEKPSNGPTTSRPATPKFFERILDFAQKTDVAPIVNRIGRHPAAFSTGPPLALAARRHVEPGCRHVEMLNTRLSTVR